MKILLVEDEKHIRDSIISLLELEAIEVVSAENGLSAKRILEHEVFSAVVTDLRMPGLDGLELLEWIQKEGPSVPVIMMSAYGEISDAVEAMKLGALDYIVKPFDSQEFIIRLRRIVKNQEMKELVEFGQREIPYFVDWIGESPGMIEIKRMVEKIAPISSTVLITGESGTGKEVIAKAIHRRSPRAEKPFMAINIAGIPDNLLESELFGYEKGAFTGASSRKIGMFELASSGTLFLDEIGDMPIHLQVKLLRVIQDRRIQRLGGVQSIPINARIIAATNRDLEERVHKELFREDLFYRLNVIRIEVPPLKERRNDIPLLAGHFVTKFSSILGKSVQYITPDVIKMLQNYDFPGNVRELENIIERAVILAETDIITVKDLSIKLAVTPKYTIRKGTLDEVQRETILTALRRWEGNRTRTAEELGITRRTLLRKIREYGFEDV